MLMVRPGKMAIQGAFSAYSSALPESINPHEGVGSAVPSPRKLKEASTRMALPNGAVSITQLQKVMVTVRSLIPTTTLIC